MNNLTFFVCVLSAEVSASSIQDCNIYLRHFWKLSTLHSLFPHVKAVCLSPFTLSYLCLSPYLGSLFSTNTCLCCKLTILGPVFLSSCYQCLRYFGSDYLPTRRVCFSAPTVPLSLCNIYMKDVIGSCMWKLSFILYLCTYIANTALLLITSYL